MEKRKADKLMKPRRILTTLFYILISLIVGTSAAAIAAGAEETNTDAEWIILTSGEKFQTDHSWQEEGRIKFRLNGLVVSVPEGDVARVIKPGSKNGAPAVGDKASQPPPAAPRMTASAPQTLRDQRRERLQNALRLPPPQAGRASDTPRPTTLKQARTHPTIPDSTAEPPAMAPSAEPAPRSTQGVFRDLAWGMRPSSMPGLLLSQTNPAYGGVDEFFYPEEELKLGEALLNGIVYGFWQNRLYTITIWTDGRPRYEKLRKWVLDTYGPGHQRSQAVERRIWFGDGSDRMLEFDEALNTGIFWMRSHKLHARIEQLQSQ
jgi:hypothetical protein